MEPESPRQRVEKQRGAPRRAKLTPVDGTDTSPEAPVIRSQGSSGEAGSRGPNDDRLRNERPPHW